MGAWIRFGTMIVSWVLVDFLGSIAFKSIGWIKGKFLTDRNRPMASPKEFKKFSLTVNGRDAAGNLNVKCLGKSIKLPFHAKLYDHLRAFIRNCRNHKVVALGAIFALGSGIIALARRIQGNHETDEADELMQKLREDGIEIETIDDLSDYIDEGKNVKLNEYLKSALNTEILDLDNDGTLSYEEYERTKRIKRALNSVSRDVIEILLFLDEYNIPITTLLELFRK